MPTWTEQAGPLPTLPGKASGIVESWQGSADRRARITVQCSTCYRTRTDDVLWAVKACTFATDPDMPGWTKYRRCEDCRHARRHPEAR